MKLWLALPVVLVAGSAAAQPILVPLQRQPQAEAPPNPPSPVPVAPPQAGPTVVPPAAPVTPNTPAAAAPAEVIAPAAK